MMRRLLLLLSVVVALAVGAHVRVAAAPIATPAPASASALPAPVPNPVPYVFAANTVVSSGAANSDNFAPWLYLQNTLLPQLNGTTYACGPCVTGLTAGAGISVINGSPLAGYGVTSSIANTGLLGLSAAAPLATSTGQNPSLSCPQCARLDVGDAFLGAVSFGSSVTLTSTSPLTLGNPGTGNIAALQLANSSGASGAQHVTLIGSNNASNQCVMSVVIGSVLCAIDAGHLVALAMDSSGDVQIAGTHYASAVDAFSGDYYTPGGVNMDFCVGGNCTGAAVDTAFNFYGASYRVVSARRTKRDIHPLTTDPLSIARTVRPMWWTYRREHRGAPQHLGLVADDTAPEISGPKRDSYDVGALAAVDAAAITELEHRVARLERDLELERAAAAATPSPSPTEGPSP